MVAIMPGTAVLFGGPAALGNGLDPMARLRSSPKD
jgi:hypothetical protein